MGFSIFKKIMNVSLLACLFFFAAEVAGSENKTPAWLQIKPEDQQALGLKYENVVVKIPGLKREYKFIWISDLHVMAEDVSEIEDKWKAAMIYRRDKHFMNPQSKLNPAAVWKKLPAILNQSNADALFFGGDICDTGSIANQTLLKSGFKQLTKPFIYLKEDHDISPWHLINRDNSRQKEIARETDGYPLAQSIEYDDLSVIGISYSMVHLKADAVLTEIFHSQHHAVAAHFLIVGRADVKIDAGESIACRQQFFGGLQLGKQGRFGVHGASAVEVAVLFYRTEGVGLPTLAAIDDIVVGHQQDVLLAVCAFNHIEEAAVTKGQLFCLAVQQGKGVGDHLIEFVELCLVYALLCPDGLAVHHFLEGGGVLGVLLRGSVFSGAFRK